MEILLTKRFSTDLDNLYENLKVQWDSEIALDVVRKVMYSISNLAEFPFLGSSLSKEITVATDLRKIYIEKNYIFYRIEGNKIIVLRMLHERRHYFNHLFEQ
ncbi:type II toxin-antitoxin system RelE/ParE family toxin [Paenisporosarcina cavernae]|uniref:Type II toxin-antitoxin system RelE/ParE family toxin n=1 Tax=Paenisporosarcina cavernae TaxID=2320858 RepID=A0A385YVH0_9BACL|nr:type II toxin-antitoxin system RelE/ParE family toxin [Paenisporosarcina cavernae]AYC30280.1 type II toxin-antitoxin system RelE/ParE family toxin [Paenisporosarcina cavernae]